MSSEPYEIFISYAHGDEDLLEKLQKHLAGLRNASLINEWQDRRILLGTDWAGQIDKHLNSARIILLLISSDFFASNYCSKIEMPRALERCEAGEARVIPIILRPVEWETWPISRLECAPRDARPVTSWTDPNEAFVDVVKGIRKVIQELGEEDKKRGIPWLEWQKLKKPELGRIVELSAQLAELLANDHAHGNGHQGLGPSSVLVDEQGKLSLLSSSLVPNRASDSSEAREDLRGLGRILYESLIGSTPPEDAAERAANLDQVARLPASLKRLILRATGNQSDWLADGLRAWAQALRASQTGALLADHIQPGKPYSAGSAVDLAVAICEMLMAWRQEKKSYGLISPELILLDEK